MRGEGRGKEEMGMGGGEERRRKEREAEWRGEEGREEEWRGAELWRREKRGEEKRGGVLIDFSVLGNSSFKNEHFHIILEFTFGFKSKLFKLKLHLTCGLHWKH